MSILDKLKELEYHDRSIEKVIISFEEQEIHLAFSLDGVTNFITYKGVKSYSLSGITKLEDVEIYTVDYLFDNDIYFAHFTILLGQGLPCVEMKFDFTDAIIEQSR